MRITEKCRHDMKFNFITFFFSFPSSSSFSLPPPRPLRARSSPLPSQLAPGAPRRAASPFSFCFFFFFFFFSARLSTLHAVCSTISRLLRIGSELFSVPAREMTLLWNYDARPILLHYFPSHSTRHADVSLNFSPFPAPNFNLSHSSPESNSGQTRGPKNQPNASFSHPAVAYFCLLRDPVESPIRNKKYSNADSE